MKLYKYCSPAIAEKILRDNTLYFSDPTGFNDPFDCHLPLSVTVPFEEAYFRDDAKMFAEALKDPELNQITEGLIELALSKFPDLREKPDQLIKKIIELQDIINPMAPKRMLGLKKDFYKDFGVTCFSSKTDTILLWSHYANNHRGVCLEFDGDMLKKFGTLGQVSYVDKYMEENQGVRILYDDKPDTKVQRENLSPMQNAALNVFAGVLTKAKCWEYESEFRLIRDYPESNVGVFEMPQKTITGIIFGCQCSAEDKIKYARMAIENNYKANLSQAKLAQNTYSLEIHEQSIIELYDIMKQH
jgi:hypothetical protein